MASFDIDYIIKKPEIRQEIFNFKSKESQKKFFNVTNFSNKFGSCFNPNYTPEQNMNKYFKTLDDVLHQCFEKIRIKSRGPSKNPRKSDIQIKIEERSNMKAWVIGHKM